MYIIDSTTVRVDSFGELSSILTENNEFTYIYLGVDINMTSGILLNNNRTFLIIDGEYPEGSGNIYTLRDEGGDSGMIHKDNVSPLDITFQNMTITGRNYFGMPRIADGNVNVMLTYRNVTYTGPQITWHLSGLTRYIDCDITVRYAGYSAVHEVAEVCRLEIGGRTIIRHEAGSVYAAFFFYNANASLTILEDAEVEISTNNDFLYHGTYIYPPPFVIRPRASLTLTTQKGISRSSSFRFASFLVDEGASFKHIQLSNAEGEASMFIDGAFTVNQGARVYMQADFTSSSGAKRLVQFTSISSARGLYLDNPKSFVLYNRGLGTAIYFSASTPFVFSGGQVNFWRDAGLFPAAGTFDDPPLYPWHNPDWSSFEIAGSATTDSTTISYSTLTPPVSPALSNLQLHLARVLSVGELPLEVYPVVDDQTPVQGKTDPSANIRVAYTDEGVSQMLTGVANAAGIFSVPTPAPISLETEVTVSANVPFLYVTALKIVEDAGELYIESAPPLIEFVAPAISPPPLCICGRSANEPVWVVDKRVYRTTQWELMASIDGPMHCDETSHILPGQVIYVPVGSPFDDEEPLEPGIFKRVYVCGTGEERTEVKWESGVGILLHITGAIHLGDKYNANLLWQVQPIEPDTD